MMKKLFYSGFLAAALVFAGCSSDDDNGTVNNQTDCELAVEAAQDAKVNYDAATDANYVTLCNAYKAALQAKIQACGDEDGAVQAIINSLGDCSVPVTGAQGTLSVNAGSMNTVFTDIAVVRQGGMVKVSGESVTGTYTLYFEVEENATGQNILQDFAIKIVSVMTPVEGSFNSNITANTDGILKGTFNGIVKNNDNGHAELTNGIIDIEY